jgi:hypothetical protein
MEVLLKILETQGIAVAMLAVITYGAWKATSWFGREIAIPIKNDTISHLHQVNETMTNMDKTMKNSNAHLEQLSEKVNDMHIKITDIHSRWDKS